MKRRLLLVAVGVAVLLAGCSGVPLIDSGPEGEPPTNVSYPLGTSPTGFTDPGAIAGSAKVELANTSYTHQTELTLGGETQRYTIWHAPNTTRSKATVHGNTYNSWSHVNDRTELTLTDRGKLQASLQRHHYDSLSSSFRGPVTRGALQASTNVTERMLHIGNYKAVGTVQGPDGEYIKYRATNGNVTKAERMFGGPGVKYDGLEYDGTVLISQDGVIRQMNVTMAAERDGETRTVTYNHSVSNVGETEVTRPEFDGVTVVEGEMDKRGRMVALTHKGGPDFTDDLEVKLGPRDRTYTVNASLDEPFTEGDTVYIYIVNKDTHLEAHATHDRSDVPVETYTFRQFELVDIAGHRTPTDGFSVEFHHYARNR